MIDGNYSRRALAADTINKQTRYTGTVENSFHHWKLCANGMFECFVYATTTICLCLPGVLFTRKKYKLVKKKNSSGFVTITSSETGSGMRAESVSKF